jgi:hypothetical protein
LFIIESLSSGFILLINSDEAIITEVIDNSWDAFGLLKDFIDNIIGKEEIGSTGSLKMMGDIIFCFRGTNDGRTLVVRPQ